MLLTRPQTLLRPHRLLATALGALRSAAFLASFIGIYWGAVCTTRTRGLARALPCVSHDFWDGPRGCIMAGCLLCGTSIWLENGRRRGEMALYVLPRAVRAILPDRLVKSGHRGVRLAERYVFRTAQLVMGADRDEGFIDWRLCSRSPRCSPRRRTALTRCVGSRAGRSRS